MADFTGPIIPLDAGFAKSALSVTRTDIARYAKNVQGIVDALKAVKVTQQDVDKLKKTFFMRVWYPGLEALAQRFPTSGAGGDLNIAKPRNRKSFNDAASETTPESVEAAFKDSVVSGNVLQWLGLQNLPTTALVRHLIDEDKVMRERIAVARKDSDPASAIRADNILSKRAADLLYFAWPLRNTYAGTLEYAQQILEAAFDSDEFQLPDDVIEGLQARARGTPPAERSHLDACVTDAVQRMRGTDSAKDFYDEAQKALQCLSGPQNAVARAATQPYFAKIAEAASTYISQYDAKKPELLKRHSREALKPIAEALRELLKYLDEVDAVAGDDTGGKKEAARRKELRDRFDPDSPPVPEAAAPEPDAQSKERQDLVEKLEGGIAIDKYLHENIRVVKSDVLASTNLAGTLAKFLHAAHYETKASDWQEAAQTALTSLRSLQDRAEKRVTDADDTLKSKAEKGLKRVQEAESMVRAIGQAADKVAAQEPEIKALIKDDKTSNERLNAELQTLQGHNKSISEDIAEIVKLLDAIEEDAAARPVPAAAPAAAAAGGGGGSGPALKTEPTRRPVPPTPSPGGSGASGAPPSKPRFGESWKRVRIASSSTRPSTPAPLERTVVPDAPKGGPEGSLSKPGAAASKKRPPKDAPRQPVTLEQPDVAPYVVSQEGARQQSAAYSKAYLGGEYSGLY